MVTFREGPVSPVFPPGSEQQVSPLPTVCLYAEERVWSSLRQSMQYFQGQGERECDQRPTAGRTNSERYRSYPTAGSLP